LDANIGGVFNVQWPQFGMSVAAWPTWTDKINWDKPDFVETHPLVHHYVTTADTRPHTISDIATPREWGNSPACSSIKAALDGASHHLAIPLDVIDKPYRSLSVGRPGRDFTPREKSLVERLQPLLLTLDRHLRTISDWRDRHPPGLVVEASAAVEATQTTPRELAVLTLLAEGLTAASIARRLGITVHTVSKHQQNVYRKLGTNDRLACVLLARDTGILPARSS
jgi:DNA-binding CsgD family transcriptional regulator